jgi:putative oxidoreductase
MNTVILIAQVVLGLLFLLAGFLHATRPIEQLAKQSPWATALPLPMVRFIGVAEVLGGLGVLLAPLAGQAWLVALAASGLALIMLLAAIFHVTRREYPATGVTLVLGALAAFVAYGSAVLTAG